MRCTVTLTGNVFQRVTNGQAQRKDLLLREAWANRDLQGPFPSFLHRNSSVIPNVGPVSAHSLRTFNFGLPVETGVVHLLVTWPTGFFFFFLSSTATTTVASKASQQPQEDNTAF